MAANSFADTVVNGMLSWLKGFANWVLRLFDLAGSGGVSPLEWLSEHWLQLLIVLLIVGVAADVIVWLIRWRPYWVWFRKKRIVVDDKSFFEDDPRAIDARAPEREAMDGKTVRMRPARRPNTIVPREDARAGGRPKRATVRPGAGVSRRRPARKAAPPSPPSDIFEDELFKIEPHAHARRVREDAVFNVSDLPGAEPAKKPRPAPRKREERTEDDLFDIK